MAVYMHSGISVDSWVDVEPHVPIRYELNGDDTVTMYFGNNNDFVLGMHSDTLRELAAMTTKAITELDAAASDNTADKE